MILLFWIGHGFFFDYRAIASQSTPVTHRFATNFMESSDSSRFIRFGPPYIKETKTGINTLISLRIQIISTQ
jgi:hypothetical protein